MTMWILGCLFHKSNISNAKEAEDIEDIEEEFVTQLMIESDKLNLLKTWAANQQPPEWKEYFLSMDTLEVLKEINGTDAKKREFWKNKICSFQFPSQILPNVVIAKMNDIENILIDELYDVFLELCEEKLKQNISFNLEI